ncbi:hypothetical protein D3C84_917890 [compost metagenome]
MGECSHHQPGYHVIDVDVGQQRGGVLATELEGDPGQFGLHRRSPYGNTGGNRAGKRNLAHLGMLGQPLANLAGTGHDVDRAIRDPYLCRQLHQTQQAERGKLAGFEYNGATCRQRRAQFPHGNQQREVPRHDTGDHPYRLATGKGGVLLPGHRGQ